ncbi:subtilisin-like protein [Thozetella sp. PMI_491]|nr:subtilisin-like protein [Thozetella sp. PMI_491]
MLSLSFALAIASFGLASPTKSPLTIHEKRADVELHSIRRDRVPQDHVFPMRIGLAQKNLHNGYSYLMDVSDPGSPNFGKHWTPEQVKEAFAPPEESVKAVKEWLSSSGIARDRVSLTSSGGWLAFDATAKEAEELLRTEYYHYEDVLGGQLSAGCEEYSVPSHLAKYIDFVYPGIVMAEVSDKATLKRARQSRRQSSVKRQGVAALASGVDVDCSILVTPECIASQYSIPAADKAAPGNALGVFEKGSWYQFADLDQFFETYAPSIPQGTRPTNLSIDLDQWFFDVVSTDTFPNEADLDLDVAYPIVYPQNITVFQVDDMYYTHYSSYLGIMNTFLDAIDGTYCNYSAYGETGDNPKYDPSYPDNNKAILPGHPEGVEVGNYKGPRMCGVYSSTNVISVSYARAETAFSDSYQKRQCDEFLKLGLQGISVVVSSGDSGPLASGSCGASNLGSFVVYSPVNCPYVTSVGATQLLADGTEAAAWDSNWASSGGFSRFFPAPAYQQEVVASYFANHDPKQDDKINRTGRAVPDVAALGQRIAVVEAGEATTDAGTSASTPLFASLLNRVNEERLAAGKSTVGFVNPVLYANPQVFNDITSGNSSMCGGVRGFDAVEGWDPITGLGSPSYPDLLEVFMALP